MTLSQYYNRDLSSRDHPTHTVGVNNTYSLKGSISKLGKVHVYASLN